MSAIAIITARGGSKRVPKKNIKSFCGQPIINYSIHAALESKLFDTVMVSTDSEEIRDIALSEGAEVPFLRGNETSGDYATTADVIKEVLTEYKKRNLEFDSFCCLYPTAPFVTAEKLQKASALLNENNADSVITVVRYSFPPQRAMIIDNGYLGYQYPEFQLSRSQDLCPIYHDCGQFYFCRTERFFSTGSLVMEKTCPIIVPEEEVQDIDTLSDWSIAEVKYRTFVLKENM